MGLGELAVAAGSLAASGRRVAIVTGFYIPTAEPPAAETDGPPGSVALAATLVRLGMEATVVTDPPCGPAVRAAAEAAGLEDDAVREFADGAGFERYVAEGGLSHLIAVEREGPGYCRDSVRERFGETAAERFASLVPADAWRRSHNMRGLAIDGWTADFSGPFERAGDSLFTIGLGDGGNELGLGKFDWSQLAVRLEGLADPRILCRIACDAAVVAGTSNWAAYGLAAATAALAGQPDAFAPVTPERETAVLEATVLRGPAVDGITRRFEPTVDGLPLVTYLQPLVLLRRRLGLDG